MLGRLINAVIALVMAISITPVTRSAMAETDETLATAVEAAWQRLPNRRLPEAQRRESSAMRERVDYLLAGTPALKIKHLNDVLLSDNGYREWEGGVELPVWLPGQRDLGRREASRTEVAADALSHYQRLLVAGEVRERAWALALARNERDHAKRAVDSARELQTDVARRVAAGELARIDLILAEEETITREDELLGSESELSNKQREFFEYTGLSRLPDPILEPEPGPSDLPEDHPGLVLARSLVETARAQRNRIQGERRPNPVLWLGGKSEKAARGEDYESSLGLEITLPLGGSAESATALAQSETRLTEALAELAGVERRLGADLAQAIEALELANATLERAVQRKGLAEDGLRLNRRGFELGESSLFQLLRARQAALQARQLFGTRTLDRGRAIARLNQALGEIPQ